MKGPCTFPGCLRGNVRRGLCRPHVSQVMKGQPLTAIPCRQPALTICKEDPCGRKVRSRGLCWRHLRYTFHQPTPRGIRYAPRRADLAERGCRLEYRPDQRIWALVQARMKKEGIAKGEVIREAMELWAFVQRNGRLPGSGFEEQRDQEARPGPRVDPWAKYQDQA